MMARPKPTKYKPIISRVRALAVAIVSLEGTLTSLSPSFHNQFRNRMQKHPYFIDGRVIVLAHRGGSIPTENTIPAIELALNAGVDVIETDIQSTRDGIAVLFHDDTIERLTGLAKPVSELTWQELSQIKLSGDTNVTSLEKAITTFPEARFNIDVKAEAAIADLIRVVERHKAHDRVLVSSFSNKRRMGALRQFSKPVATSASASVVLKVWLLCLLGLPSKMIAHSLDGIGALQIPRRMKFIKLDSPRFVKKIKATGTQLHYWTINDPKEILELASLGADGIVTDVPELAVQTLRKA
jgi:glycerophosphoryl diester phosphodiesterase